MAEAVINGIKVTGTVQEIAELLKSQPKSKNPNSPNGLTVAEYRKLKAKGVKFSGPDI